MILVYGDVMLDLYCLGPVRHSAEADSMIFALRRQTVALGGAANVAANVASLGVTATLVAVIGPDPSAEILYGLLAAQPRLTPKLLTCSDRLTTVKQRFMTDGAQMFRCDMERAEPLTDSAERKIIRRLIAELRGANAVVISDYGKGGVTPKAADALVKAASAAGKPTVIDTKSLLHACWRGATVLKPNLKEIGEALGKEPANEFEAGSAASALRGMAAVDHVLLTCGEQGMCLADKDGACMIPSIPVEAADVTGAGDTVAAAMAIAMGSGKSALDAAMLATTAASVVVGKTGTATATVEEIDDLARRFAGQLSVQGQKVARAESAYRLH